MTDRRSITLPLCVLGAGAVHGLCVAAMLPMLITLPGPGASVPPAIDVEVLQPATVPPNHPADPATTSALPKLDISSPRSGSEPAKTNEDAVEPAAAGRGPIEVPPDDTPQQIAVPDAPARTGIDALTPEPLAPTLVNAPMLGAAAIEDVEQVTVEPDAATTSSIVPVTTPEVEDLGEAPIEASPPPVSETPPPKTEPQPEVVHADPKEETPPQETTSEDGAEAERPSAPPSVAKPKVPSKTEAKAQTKTPPGAAKKRSAAGVKRSAPQSRRVVKGRTQPPANQGIMSIFGGALRPPDGANASAKRPAVQRQ